MITHIVMWKYRSEIQESVREDHLAQLRSLTNIVPGIETFEVGFDTLHSPRSYDTGLLAHFLDRVLPTDYGRWIGSNSRAGCPASRTGNSHTFPKMVQHVKFNEQMEIAGVGRR